MPKSCPAFQASRPLLVGQVSPWLHPGTDPARFPRPSQRGMPPQRPRKGTGPPAPAASVQSPGSSSTLRQPDGILPPRYRSGAASPRPGRARAGTRPKGGTQVTTKPPLQRQPRADRTAGGQSRVVFGSTSDTFAAHRARQVKGGLLKERFAKGVPCKYLKCEQKFSFFA